jgi:hypothetical protein
MNSTLLKDNGHSRSYTRCASMVATLLAVSVLVFLQPVLAQSQGNSPLPSDDLETGDITPPSFGEPWDDPPNSFAGPALAPAPKEPTAPQASPIFGGLDSGPSAGPWMEPPESPLAQPWVNPSISATNQMPELPSENPVHGPIR